MEWSVRSGVVIRNALVLSLAIVAAVFIFVFGLFFLLFGFSASWEYVVSSRSEIFYDCISGAIFFSALVVLVNDFGGRNA